jgi:ATP-dependent helicase/nuclease subunit A
MTRARDRLIVCGAQHGNAKTGEAEESWRRVVDEALAPVAESFETPFGAGLRIGAARKAGGTRDAKSDALALPDWARTLVGDAVAPMHAAPSRLKRADPALFSPRGDGQKRFRRGRLIHGLLQRLPDIAPERRAGAASTWLKRQGASAEEAEAFAAEAMRVVEDARFAALFGPGSRAEVPIVGMCGKRAVRGVVDRLAIDDEGVLLLDFKTDRPAPPNAREAPEPYVLQMALYREVIGKIFPQKRVRCALLWTEIPNLVELEDGQLAAQIQAFAQG